MPRGYLSTGERVKETSLIPTDPEGWRHYRIVTRMAFNGFKQHRDTPNANNQVFDEALKHMDISALGIAATVGGRARRIHELRQQRLSQQDEQSQG